MDLRIPNILKPIQLSDYAPEFGDAVIYVWVNPTRERRMELLDTILKGEANDEMIGAWFAEIWSQGAGDTRFTPDEVLKLANNCMEQDPRLWIWLVNETVRLITEHYSAKKKPSILMPQ